MRISNATGPAITASVAVAILAGCAGGGYQTATPVAQVPGGGARVVQDGRAAGVLATRRDIVSGHPVTTPSFFSPDAAGKPLIFVSDFQHSVVDIYLQAGKNKMVGQITGHGGLGLATDTASNLYVVDGPPDVLVYSPPYTEAPTLKLDDTGYLPEGVAVSPLGVVGVTNYCNAPSCVSNTASVRLYAQNSTTPCATLVDPNFPNLWYDSFDDRGNLYIVGQNSTGGTVIGEVTGGCQAKLITLLTVNNSIGYGTGIQVDKADRIAILASGTIYTYNPPKRGSLGSPVSTTPLTSAGLPVAFAFAKSGHDLYTAEEGSNALSELYDFPVGGAPEKSITVTGSSQGVAVTPPLVP